MKSTTRIVVNTLAQHIRSVFNICLSLYSTRLVLGALGQTDYGIYSLISGVVIMLGFITNAMVVTTQRHLSFFHGKGDADYLHKVFANSLFLHVFIGLLIGLVLLFIESYLFNGGLNIDASRISVATIVYKLTILNLLLSFITAPYRALFFARENIVYISIVDMMDGILKLLLAIWLLYIDADKLIAYSWMMVAITAFNLFAFAIYATGKFDEASLRISRKDIDKKLLKQITGFAGWTIYSTGCIIGRTQGIAVILNRFFGTLFNASYGIAMQVSGSIQFVAQAVLNAMSPQVVKAEGAHDRLRMLQLAEATCKYSFLMQAIVVIPLVFEMDTLLQLWLGDVPQSCVMFCRFILITSLCDQLTIGLGIANQAIGKIRNYSLVINTTKVLTLPAAWFLLHSNYDVASVMWAYLSFEILCCLIRLPFLKYTAGLSIRHFAIHVFGRVLLPTVCMVIGGLIIIQSFNLPYRFLMSIPAIALVGIFFIWFTSLEQQERIAALQILKIKNRPLQ